MQKTTYSMIHLHEIIFYDSFTWNVQQKGKFIEMAIRNCLGPGLWPRIKCKQVWRNFIRWWKCSKTGLWWWLPNSIHLLITIKLKKIKINIIHKGQMDMMCHGGNIQDHLLVFKPKMCNSNLIWGKIKESQNEEHSLKYWLIIFKSINGLKNN